MYAPQSESKAKERFEDGVYTGIPYKIIDLGSHKFNQDDPKIRRKVWLEWELEELMSSGKPFSVSKEFTFSYYEKADLAKAIYASTGSFPHATYNIEDMLGRPCNLSIMHNEGGWPKITGFSPLKRGEKTKRQVNPNFVFDLSNPRQADLDSLPDFLKAKIISSPEYQAVMNPKPKAAPQAKNDGIPDYVTAPGVDDDDIPFSL